MKFRIMDDILLVMKFWTDGYENSTRIRNVNYTFRKLKDLNIFLVENGIKSKVKIYDFSPHKIIDEAAHKPFESGVYMKSAKTNIIINENYSFKFMMMFDCDAFFSNQDYVQLLAYIKALEQGDILTFDLAKLNEKDSILVIQNDNINFDFDWSYAYSGEKNNGPLCCGHKGALGGVYICDLNLLRKVGGFNEEFIGWGGEDSDVLNRIYKSNQKHRHLSINKIAPFHLNHFSDWSNEKYAKRFKNQINE